MSDRLPLLPAAFLALWPASASAVELSTSMGLGAPTGHFERYDTKVELGPVLAAAVEGRLIGPLGLRAQLQAAFLEGPELDLSPNHVGQFEGSARQLALLGGPSLLASFARAELALHLDLGLFDSRGTVGIGAYDGPGGSSRLHISGPAAGLEGAAFYRASPRLSVGLVGGYTRLWARQRNVNDERGYQRGFFAVSFALRFSTRN